MPDRAVEIAWPQPCTRCTEDIAFFILYKRRNTRPVVTGFLFKAHILCKSAALAGNYFEFPPAAGGELRLLLGRVGRDQSEACPIRQMLCDSVEAVCPKRTINTRAAHIVDDDQVAFIAEQLGKPYFPAVSGPKGVVFDWFERQLFAQFGKGFNLF